MRTESATRSAPSPVGSRLFETTDHRHVIVPRLVAGLPLLGIGVAHVVVAEAPMRPLVEAAGFPMPGILAPIAVAAEILAGISLLLGLFARVGGVVAIPTMLGAVYTHLVIDVWPNAGANEPPLALPIVVMVAAAYVVWRGAGRWSLDRRLERTGRGRFS